MFQNKKIKALENRNVELAGYVSELKSELNIALLREKDKDKEIKSLQNFNNKIDDKLEELCKPKIDAFCLSLVGSGLCVSSATFNSAIKATNQKYVSLEELLTSQAKEIEKLKISEEDTKKVLFLAGKVEQLINQLKKGK
jgi:hypothetical protein